MFLIIFLRARTHTHTNLIGFEGSYEISLCITMFSANPHEESALLNDPAVLFSMLILELFALFLIGLGRESYLTPLATRTFSVVLFLV